VIAVSWLPRALLDRIMQLLRVDGRRVIGPRVSNGAVVHDEVDEAAGLPRCEVERVPAEPR
jgi:hypothetical protein